MIVNRESILSRRITDVFVGTWVLIDSVTCARAFVVLGDGFTLEIDSTGVEKPEPLRICSNCPPTALTRTMQELRGCRITDVVVSDSMATFGLVLENDQVLFCSDYGPPFDRFGPLVMPLRSVVSGGDLVDFWTRTALRPPE